MLRTLLIGALSCAVCAACGSSSDTSDTPAGAGNSNSGHCPDLSGDWTVAEHCEASLVGQTLQVTQRDCALSIAAPFDGFAGVVTSAGKITLSGPQSCTGAATTSSISMNCTPDTCVVKLSR